MNSILSMNEAPTRIARTRASNLVKALRGTRQDNSITETSCLVNPPSTDCFMNGNAVRNRQLSNVRPILCVEGIHEAQINMAIATRKLPGKRYVKPTGVRLVSRNCGSRRSRAEPFTKAVCNQRCFCQVRTATQTLLNKIQALSTPDNLVDGASNSLTKPHDPELVEHVDSFDGGPEAFAEAKRKMPLAIGSRSTFKAISLERCVVPMRVREQLLALTIQ